MGKQEDDQTDLGSLPGSLPMESLKSSPNPSAGSSGSSVGSRNKKAYAILGETKISINGGLQNGNGVYKGSGEFDASLGPPRTPGPGGGKSGKISPFFEKIDKDLETSEEEEKPPEYKPVPFFKLFRFSSTQDKILLAIGVLAAICGGCTMPVMIVLFGGLANAFVTDGIDISEQICLNLPSCCENNLPNFNLTGCDVNEDDLNNLVDGSADFFDEITKFGLGTSIIGLINFVMSYIFVTCLNHAAECQVYRIRGLFLKSILRQDIGWYDTHQTGDFASKMAEDLNKLQEGIGEKIGMFLFFMTIFCASMVNAFYHGWELTLVILAAMPVLMIATGIIARSQTALTEKEMSAYGRAGAIAEEVLSSIRTVVAFGGQDKEVDRYEGKLFFARKAGMMRGFLTGVGGGLMWFIIYSSYALAFWYGVKLIMDDRESCIEDLSNCQVRYDPSSLLVVFFSVLMGAMNVGQASPYVEAFSMAKGAAATIFAIIDRTPEIDSLSEEGLRPDEKNDEATSRDIIFKDVHFTYPARPEVPVLRGLSLAISKGETVALVGTSGCGKSTCIQLVQRFYDPDQGSVFLGQHDIKSLNVEWLRQKIGVVGQEPVLFGCTIAENIRYGRDGVTDDEIERVCKEANAYDYISKLPKKYDTLVGERGAQLSGGQKQRLAIARALVRNPEILLLDEATSALDTQSEAVVQAALDKARAGRTTIIVAHRLSTIRTADKIVAIKDGTVREIGTHDQLMAKKGLYHSLVMAQIQKDEDEVEQEEGKDVVEELEIVETSLPSMVSLNNGQNPVFPGRKSQLTRKRSKAKLERKISVSSIMSEDSFTVEMEETSKIVGSALGFSRMNSQENRQSLRERTLARQDSVQVQDEADEDLPKVSPLRIVKTNAPEWPYIVMGGLASIVMGASMPVYAILFGEVLGVLAKPIATAREESVTYSILFLVVGVVVGLAMFLQVAMFTVAGEHLTLRMRKLAFAAMLRQEMGWFDEPNNNTGALCARLSADAAAIQGAIGARAGAVLQSLFTLVMAVGAGIYHEWRLGLVGACYVPPLLVSSTFQARIMASQDSIEKDALATSSKGTGTRIGTILQSSFTLVISISLSLYYQWKLGLVTSLFVPLVLVAIYWETKIVSGQDTVEKEALEASAKLAIEAITNIRTVAGLCREKTFVKRYIEELAMPHKQAKRKSHFRGLVFGFAQSMPFFAYAGCMYYGGYLVDKKELEYENVFKVAEALILGTMMVGQATAFAPNYNKAVLAAARVFKLLDRRPLIDGQGQSGLRLNKMDGEISWKKAAFRYPTRPQVRVLRGLDLNLTSGQKVALVGPSGCGKSTCIQLLQRFYDLKQGELTIDDHNIEGLNVPWIRSQLGIVSQEPILFDRTLADNIKYGDNMRNVTMDEVVEAAKQANIHTFIASLPQGYDTRVGEKGTQLSGGQKQRVAIARALVRNPAVLLLDEATSALDTESEKVVQEALDKAQEGRTSITIAHRLSTVQNMDRIFVISGGRVVEDGTHSELVNLRGLYAKLWANQAGAI